MSSVTVDELVMRIEIELDKFRAEAGQAENIEKKLRKSLEGTEEAARDAGESIDDMAESVGKSTKEMGKHSQSLAFATTRVLGFVAAIAGSGAIQKFVKVISDANDQLGFMSQRLGMSARDIKGVETAVSALGGSGASATATMLKLNQGIQEMVLMGNTSLMPFFSALGVGVVDSTGSLREMDDVLLDMADSLSKMDPRQAYALASSMGLDDGVANALIQGRDAMQEMLDMQKKVAVSSAEEIRASRELSRAQAFLNAQWEGLKTMLGNVLIPLMTKLTKTVSGWMDYLSRNERTVKNFFEGISIAVGVLLLPMLLKAGVAMLALISPVVGAAAVVLILAAAFGLLYDDYKTWAEGGNSLFDWSAFKKYIEETDVSVDSLAKGLARLLTGYDSLNEAQAAFMGWLRKKGIIDQNGLSIKGLGEAFKGLGRDIVEAIPALKTMVEMIGAVVDGRWKDALSLAKSIPSQMAGTLLDASGAVAGRVAGAADAALGHDPSSGGTLSSGVASMFSTVRGLLGGGSVSSGSSEGLTPPAQLMPLFQNAAEKHGVPVNALIALAHQESRFNTSATGVQTKYGKAQGIMQYIPPTAKSLGIDPMDAGQSIDAAAMQLRQRLDSGDSMEDAFRFHFAGPDKRQWGAKTQIYGSEVSGKYGALNAMSLTNRGFSAGGIGAGVGSNVEVNIGSISVQTSATTLPAATKDGVSAGVSRSSELINQLGSGTQ